MFFTWAGSQLLLESPPGIHAGSHTFNIFINELDDGIESILTKLAGDTNPGGEGHVKVESPLTERTEQAARAG